MNEFELNWMNFPYPTRRFVGTKRKGLKFALSAEKRGGEIGAGNFIHFLNQSLDQGMNGILQVLQPQRETRQPLLHNFGGIQRVFWWCLRFCPSLSASRYCPREWSGSRGRTEWSILLCEWPMKNNQSTDQQPWYFSSRKMTCENNQSTEYLYSGTFLHGKWPVKTINQPTNNRGAFLHGKWPVKTINQPTTCTVVLFFTEKDLWKQSINRPTTVVLFFTENDL